MKMNVYMISGLMICWFYTLIITVAKIKTLVARGNFEKFYLNVCLLWMQIFQVCLICPKISTYHKKEER